MKRVAPLPLLAALVAAGLAAGCKSSSEESVPEGTVFVDGFGPGVSHQAFSGVPSSATIAVDTVERHAGASSLRVTVPDTAFAGGAFPADTARDLTGFNALTFWAKASKAATLNVAGFGIDNSGPPALPVERNGIALTTTWQRFVIPIPLPSRLSAERGLFHFAEGSDEGAYTIWFDDVKFETLPASELGAARPAFTGAAAALEVGGTATPSQPRVTFAVSGVDVTVSVGPRWFTWASSNGTAVTVDAAGVATATAVGSANVTAALGTIPAEGTLAVTVGAANVPALAAPAPTPAAAEVISLFSDAYTNVAIDTWSTTWDNVEVQDVQIAGNAAKRYDNLGFAGIEFIGPNSIDASAMTHFHVDVWTHAGTLFKVKLVDFGADDAFGGGDDREHELTFDATTTPALASGQWVSIDVPLSAFTGLTTRANLSQLILSSSGANVWIDNVFLHATAAPPASAVVFADDYAAGVTFAPFGGSTNDVAVDGTQAHAGNASLRVAVPAGGYTGGALVSASQDLSGYDALTFWAKASRAATLDVAGAGNDAVSTTFQVERGGIALGTDWAKVVIPLPRPALLAAATGLFHFAEGSDEGAYTIWIDDVRFEALGAALGPANPAIATETVSREVGQTFAVNGVSVAYPDLGPAVIAVTRRYFDWTSSNTAVATVDQDGVVTAAAAGSAQITAKLGAADAAGVTTAAVTAPSAPSAAAPTPGVPGTDVISLFSDAYTNVGVDTWSTDWDNVSVQDVSIAGNATKRYDALGFAGIEFTGANLVDASGMTHFHLDVWTQAGTLFRVKLVDFGANGVFDAPGTGDDVEHELTFDATTTPALTPGAWSSLDIPLTSFTNLTTRAHLAQLIVVSSGANVWIDNVYFHR
jgi:hypothetical protein